MSEEFKVKAGVELDTSNIQKQLDKIKNIKVNANVKIDSNSIEKQFKDIFKKTEKAINSLSSIDINKHFKILLETANKFSSQIKDLNNELLTMRNEIADIKINTKVEYDEKSFNNIEKLKNAIITYKNELDQVVKKTIEWKQIGNTPDKENEENSDNGWVESFSTEKLTERGTANSSAESNFGWLSSISEKLISLAGIIDAITSINTAIDALSSFDAIKTAIGTITTFLTTTPVGWAVLIAGGIFAAAKAFDFFTISLEEAQQAYSEVKNELANVNSELQTTSDRIKELNAKDTLTLVEQDELSGLIMTNAELERRKQLLEEEAKIKAKEANKKLYDTYKEEYLSSNTRYDDNGNIVELDESKEKKYKRQIELYNELSALGQNMTDQQRESYNKLTKEIEETSNSYRGFASQVHVVDKESENLKNNFVDLQEEGFKALHPNLWKNEKITGLFKSEKFKDIKYQLQELANAGKLDDKVLAKYPSFKKALDELGISAEDVTASIKEISAKTTTPDLSTLFSQYSGSTKLLETAKKEINDFGSFSESTYNNLVNKFPQLTDSLNNFMLGFSDNADISKILQNQYDEDVKNYNRALQINLINSKEYYDKLLENNSNLINSFSNQYGIDLGNCKTLAEAKYKIEVELANELAGIWKDYYNTSSKTFDLQRMHDDNKLLFDPRAGMNGIGGIETMSAAQRAQAEELSKRNQEIRDMLANASNMWDNLKFDDFKFFGTDNNEDSKSSKDSQKEAFLALYNFLKYQREKDEIDAQQYYDELNTLNQEYFANRKGYEEDFRQYELELYKLDQELSEKRIKNWEHNLTLKINAEGSENTKNEQIKVYTQIQNELHRLANEARKKGLNENSEYIQNLQTQWWSYEQKKFDITKQYQEEQKSLYENQISALEKLQDLTISMIKKEMELERDRHKEKIEAIKSEFDLQRDLLDNELDDYDYNKTLQSKVDNVNKLQNQIDLIKNDDTQKARLKQLEEELMSALDDMNDYQYRHGIDIQKKIYDENEKLAIGDSESQIEIIEKQLNDEVYLKNLADERIKNSGKDLYNQLIEFAEKYGISSRNEINEVWKEYEKFSSYLDISQNGVISTLDILYDKLLSVKDLLASMSEMSLGEFSSSQDIIAKMQQNSNNWHTSNDRDALAQLNLDLAEKLKILFGIEIERRKDGYWYYKDTDERVYHEGGVVNKNSNLKNVKQLQNNEVKAILEEGELIISKGGVPKFLNDVANLNNVAKQFNELSIPKLDKIEFMKDRVQGLTFVDSGVYNLTGVDENSLSKFKAAKREIIDETIKKFNIALKNNGSNLVNIKQRY